MHFRIIFKIAEKCALCVLDITVCVDRMAPQKSMTVFTFFLGVIAVPVAQHLTVSSIRDRASLPRV